MGYRTLKPIESAELAELRPLLQLLESFAGSYWPMSEAEARHSGLRWWSPGRIVSRAIGTRRAWRAALSLVDCRLLLLNQSSPRVTRIQAGIELAGVTPAAAADWLESELSRALPPGYSRALRRPPGWEQQPQDRPLALQPASLTELSRQLDQASLLLSDLADCLDLSYTPVRVQLPQTELSFRIHWPREKLEAGFYPGDRDQPARFFIRHGRRESRLYQNEEGTDQRLSELKILNFLHQGLIQTIESRS